MVHILPGIGWCLAASVAAFAAADLGVRAYGWWIVRRRRG